MHLNTRTWGSGDRVALLIHGVMSDHRAWRRVGPALADRGYRVLAVDLRGHGASGRSADYTPRAFADDLVETLPAGAELAIGHSLGGLTLSLAADRLLPRRAVYSDPAWCLPPVTDDFGPASFARDKALTRERIMALNPRWDDADVDIEVENLAAWDAATIFGLSPIFGADNSPARPLVPSLVQLADPSALVSPALAASLQRRGFEVRTVKGAGHSISRDDFDGFMSSLDGWL